MSFPKIFFFFVFFFFFLGWPIDYRVIFLNFFLISIEVSHEGSRSRRQRKSSVDWICLQFSLLSFLFRFFKCFFFGLTPFPPPGFLQDQIYLSLFFVYLFLGSINKGFYLFIYFIFLLGQIRDEIKNIVVNGSIKRKSHKELRGLTWRLIFPKRNS